MLKLLDTVAPATASAITASIYQPLIDDNDIAEVMSAHEHVQALLKAKYPKLLEQDQQAFELLVTKNAVEFTFEQFKEALDKGDLTEANKWLAMLNTMAPEHPRAAEARKLLREKNPPE